MKRAPEPTTRHLGQWRRLVALALVAAGSPRGAMGGDLANQVRLTRKAVLPVPPEALTNPFIQLHRRAERFAAETARGREAMAAELHAIAETCAAILAALETGTARRHRADLDD